MSYATAQAQIDLEYNNEHNKERSISKRKKVISSNPILPPPVSASVSRVEIPRVPRSNGHVPPANTRPMMMNSSSWRGQGNPPLTITGSAPWAQSAPGRGAATQRNTSASDEMEEENSEHERSICEKYFSLCTSLALSQAEVLYCSFKIICFLIV